MKPALRPSHDPWPNPAKTRLRARYRYIRLPNQPPTSEPMTMSTRPYANAVHRTLSSVPTPMAIPATAPSPRPIYTCLAFIAPFLLRVTPPAGGASGCRLSQGRSLDRGDVLVHRSSDEPAPVVEGAPLPALLRHNVVVRPPTLPGDRRTAMGAPSLPAVDTCRAPAGGVRACCSAPVSVSSSHGTAPPITANFPLKLPRIWPISTRTHLTAAVVRSS